MGLHHISEPLGAVIIGLDRSMADRTGASIIQTIADAGGWTAPEEGTERYRMLEAALASRGTPYRNGPVGRFDAWSLARSCATYATERDCIEAVRPPSGWGPTEAEARKVLTQWGLTEVRLRHAAPGDALLFDMPQGGVHVAVLSAPGEELSWAMAPGKSLPEPKIVHAIPARAVCESWAGAYWTSKLIGAFSFDAPGAPIPAVRKPLAVAA
jgi:hypothetical protein